MAYLYDGDGKRVAKAPSSTPTQPNKIYWYGAGTDSLVETDGAGNTLYRHYYFYGLHIARREASGWVDHYGLDALGNTRFLYGYNGAWDLSDYYPFGGERVIQSNSNNQFKFTGKERDYESGLDNFGARYFGSSTGRFMSVDPTRLSAFIDDPQTWNRYSYAHNNPLEYVDNNGKWPTRIHNQIIDTAFPGLTAEQRQILKNVSAHQDSILSGGQGNNLAFQHAMRGPGESVEQAEADFNAFVSMNEDEATRTQINSWLAGNPGYDDKALAEFAAALHAILDSTSPAHAGFQLWDWRNVLLVWKHTQAEKSINPQQLQNAVSTAQNAFNRTFHPYSQFDFLQLLQNPNEPKEHVTFRICSWDQSDQVICQ